VLEQRPDIADAVLGLFWGDLLRGEPAPAMVDAERLAGLTEPSAWSSVRLFEACLRTGDGAGAEEAASRARAAVRTMKERRLLHGQLALGYMGAGRFDDAEAEVRSALDVMPETAAPDLQARLGLILMLRGEHDEARAVLESGLERTPADAGLAVVRAANELARGDAAAAERRLRALLSTGPDEARAHRLLAYALAEQGRYGEAEPHARRQFAMDPSRDGHVALAWVLIAGDLDREAGLELAERATERAEIPYAVASRLPFVPPIEECLGRAYLEQGRYAEAVRLLQAAQSLRPDRPSIRSGLERARARR